MAKKIEYTTIDKQIKLLEQKGLLFDDINKAKGVLERYGYYNIINSYKEPYQTEAKGKKTYISGTTFEQIYSIFTLDHNLRNSIMASMLELEECLRAATAEVIAESFGVNHSEYLNFRNYRDRYCENPKFTLNAILGKLHGNAGSDKDPIKYYRKTYKMVPPWILLKGTYFSTLINLIKYLKKEQKQKLMRLVLRIPDNEAITEEITTFFQTILFVCLDYRNAAAHGGRVYNFVSKYTESIHITTEIRKIFPALNDIGEASGIQLLLVLLTVFKDRQSYIIIKDSLHEQVNRHLCRYPSDIDTLSGSIGVVIKSVNYVWINEKTKKFHAINSCSGMTNSIRKRLEEIDTSIYLPCRRCLELKEEE